MRIASGRWKVLVLAAAVAAAVAVAGCGGSSSASGSGDPQLNGTGYPGVDLANSRLAKGTIDRQSAPELEVAWEMPLSAQATYGAYSATPVIAGGVIYSQDLESDVQAIDLESGDVLWTKKFESPTQGPNGVVVAEGKVFGATGDSAFALDEETGKELWSVKLTNDKELAIDMPAGYHDGLVYVSTVPTNVNSEYPAGKIGVLWALDAKTGKRVWHFDTVPKSLWGKPGVNAGGGLWYAPSFDAKGDMYFGTGNPVPYPGTASEPWGASRPGANLYTDSLVKMDAKTGKLEWAYQQTPHDLYDWDFQDPPILAGAGGRELAIGAGKSGIVTAVDAGTGKPVWSTPVGKHNGHDDDGLLAMRGEGAKIKAGEVFPGTLGGVIAPMAANQTTVFVPVVNHALTVSPSQEIGESGSMTGELVALDLKTGKEEWNRSFGAAAFGAPTAVNDMVFVTSFDGVVHGIDAKTGGEVWQASLPAGSNSGLAISGDTLVVPAGIPVAEGQVAKMIAYRLGG
jgi:outer membrane protein assembly factor BamB